METEDEVLLRLLAAREEAQKHLCALKVIPAPDRETVRAHIRAYVFLRFMLKEEEHPSATFQALAELSIAQSAKIAPELVKELDTTKDCMGSTSVMAKKVLLLRGIEKALDITLPAMPTARISGLDDLGDLVWEALTAPSAP